MAYNYQVSHHTFNLLSNLPKAELNFHIVLSILSMALIFLVIVKLKKSSQPLERLTRILNFFAICLVGIIILPIIFYMLTATRVQIIDQAVAGEKNIATKEGITKRDIYYIILDGYARSDMYKKYYNYDNSHFLDKLRGLDFYIADKGRCNYTWTFLSLPSSLNFTYLNDLANQVDINSADLRIPYQMIKKNKITAYLKKHGYKYIHFCSTWGATLRNRYADIEVRNSSGIFRDEFLRILADTTVLKIFNSFIVSDLAEAYRFALIKLAEISQNKAATFTFAHILLPHYPYIFDAQGKVLEKVNRLNQFASSQWHKKEEYVGQSIFIGNEIALVVEKIIKQSKIEPIIVIQSDHGPTLPTKDRTIVRDIRTANLNAFFLPAFDQTNLYPSITPVNTFRIILNHYFKEKLPLLRDATYISPFNKPYQLYKYKN
jgi:hypothetical protein